MKKWKAYVKLQFKYDITHIYDEMEIDVSDKEYEILTKCVSDNIPVDESEIHDELISRVTNAEKEELKELILYYDEEDAAEEIAEFGEEMFLQMQKTNAENIEFSHYNVTIDDPNAAMRFHNFFIGRKYRDYAGKTIPLQIKMKDGLNTKVLVEVRFDENSTIEYISDINSFTNSKILGIYESPVQIHPDYRKILKILDGVLELHKHYDDEDGQVYLPGYDPKEDDDPYNLKYKKRDNDKPEDYPEEIAEKKPKPVLTAVKKEEKKEPVITEASKPVVTEVRKTETKKTSSKKYAVIAALAVVFGLSIYVYYACFVPKSPLTFDASRLASYEVDGYYDVFDCTYKDQKKIDSLIDYLDRFKYVKVLNPFEKVKDSGDRVRVSMYDENGKKLEEIIIYNDERIRVNGALCKPVELVADCFFLQSYLKEGGKQFIEDTLRPSIERMKSNAEVDGNCLIIELIDIPFDGGTYSKIWGGRTDSKTGKEKRKSVFSKTAQNYEHLPGYKMKIDFEANLGEEKLYYMWLDIDACGVTVSYNLSDIIPEQYKAEKE